MIYFHVVYNAGTLCFSERSPIILYPAGLFVGLIKCFLQGGAWNWVMYNVCGRRRDIASKQQQQQQQTNGVWSLSMEGLVELKMENPSNDSF